MAPRGKEVSPDLRERIIFLHKENNGYQNIATRLMLSKSTVAKIVQNWKKNGKIGDVSKRPGRPCKLTPKSVHYIKKLVDEDPRKSAADVANEVKKVCAVSVSITTIKRSLNKIGLHGRRPRRKPLLNSRHKQSHLKFAEENKDCVKEEILIDDYTPSYHIE